jgi:hypothetical protein
VAGAGSGPGRQGIGKRNAPGGCPGRDVEAQTLLSDQKRNVAVRRRIRGARISLIVPNVEPFS